MLYTALRLHVHINISLISACLIRHLRTDVDAVLQDNLHVCAYKRYTGHTLNDRSELRSEIAEKLLRLYGKGGSKKILYTDEKVFTVEQKFKRQNDQIYAQSSILAKSKGTTILYGHHPASVMVC